MFLCLSLFWELIMVRNLWWFQIVYLKIFPNLEKKLSDLIKQRTIAKQFPIPIYWLSVNLINFFEKWETKLILFIQTSILRLNLIYTLILFLSENSTPSYTIRGYGRRESSNSFQCISSIFILRITNFDITDYWLTYLYPPQETWWKFKPSVWIMKLKEEIICGNKNILSLCHFLK